MATGDTQDIVARLDRGGPPPGWFGDQPVIRNAIYAGWAAVHANLYGLIGFARAQTRIATATGGWLDLIAQDYFGLRLQRGVAQGDAGFRKRILQELTRERQTRTGILKALKDLTGRDATVFEPARPADTGAWASAAAPGGSMMAYGVAGAWGSLLYPAQFFVKALRPVSVGIPNVAGWGAATGTVGSGGWSTGALAYASLAQMDGVTDADIYAAVAGAKAAGTTAWVNIQS